MNKKEYVILKFLLENKYISQRNISEETGFSLGLVNKYLRKLIKEEYLRDDITLTEKANKEMKNYVPKNAIILAAGYGMRMVPVNFDVPKGLLEIKNEPLIERIINQLHKVGINEIYIVVGYLKEKYEYLIDKYNVKLIFNNEYSSKNNLHSLKLAQEHISNTYIIPCDLWCLNNPFNMYEMESWYLEEKKEDIINVFKKDDMNNLLNSKKTENKMIGISYINFFDAPKLKKNLEKLDSDSKYNNSFWEEALYDRKEMFVRKKTVTSDEVIEINTYGQLRRLDENSDNLKSDALEIICDCLKVESDEIYNIEVLKAGMTNRSFIFSVKNQRYIMRIPGEGTDKLINRKEETSVYKVLSGKRISDDIIYINPENGYKITKFLENARVCDSKNKKDLEKCMKKLREFHQLNLSVEHYFDIFEKINFYESLWQNNPSVYRDYKETKKNIFGLQKYIDKCKKTIALTHIDAVPDNFLFYNDEIRLIDWEYAAMQDTDVDIAMFCIYSLYDRTEVDYLIDLYYENKCETERRMKIYCYIAACGLLWSNWCEYKRLLGVEFGEYSLMQYRYAKEYYKIVIKKIGDECV